MNVLFFAQSREAAGCDQISLKTYRAMTQAEFWAMLIMVYPALAPFQRTARLARLETYLGADDLLEPEDEIALIPPVSGG